MSVNVSPRLAAAVLAVLAHLATPAAAQHTVVPAPPREPEITPAPVVAPPGAVVLWYADANCPPSVPSVTLPNPQRAACLMREGRLAVLGLVRRDGVAPGTKSPCWSYTVPAEYLACLDWQARLLPAVSYGHSGRYVRGSLYGTPWEGCAAGVGGDPIFVSLAEPWRVDGLLAWEAANAWLWLSYDRLDLTDGPLVAEASVAAVAACGVQ